MRFLVGPAKPDDLPPEVELFVHAVGGAITVEGGTAHVLRPLVSTETAKVDVLTDSEALLLPARRAQDEGELTYAAWVMQNLGLPDVMVPRRRRDPESDLEPLSLADFLEWCFLKQDTLEAAIFNATDSFRENKRQNTS